MLRFLAIVCCLFSTGWGYDFKDPFYNDFIMENLYTYQTKKLNGPCKRPLKYHCCDNLNEEQSAQLEQSQIDCFIEQVLFTPDGGFDTKRVSGPLDVFSWEKIKKLQKEFVCVSQCVGRKWNMTDAAGDLFSAEVLVPIVKPFYVEKVYEDAQLQQFVKQCLAYTEKNASATTELQCNPAASSFSYCLWRKSNLECPDAKRDTSAACKQMRDQHSEQGER